MSIKGKSCVKPSRDDAMESEIGKTAQESSCFGGLRNDRRQD